MLVDCLVTGGGLVLDSEAETFYTRRLKPPRRQGADEMATSTRTTDERDQATEERDRADRAAEMPGRADRAAEERDRVGRAAEMPEGADWAGEVRRLAARRDAVILAHNYQRAEIQG